MAHSVAELQAEITQGKISYDLRRLRLHGLIERIEKTHRYRVTSKGLAPKTLYVTNDGT